MKADESDLLKNIAMRGEKLYPAVMRIVYDLSMPTKRARYILGKWADKNWYEYGTSIFFGWLTPEGFNQSKKVKNNV